MKKPEQRQVKLSDVRFDESVYPRQKHDPALAQRYADNLETIEAAGKYLCLSADLRILDGRHRHLGYLLRYRDEPDREISAYVYPVEADDELLDLAAELNSTAGWQLTEKDKESLARKMYCRAIRKPQSEIAKALSVTIEKVNKWLSDIFRREQEEREERIVELWMACHTQAEIAEAVGMEQGHVSEFLRKLSESFPGKDSDNFRNFEGEDSTLRVYSVWNFPKATNEVRHPGNIPPEIIDNLLWYYTEPFDVVFDPFGGGGSTIDVCLRRKRRYYVSDLNPPPNRTDMRRHDIMKGLPGDLPVPDLAFLDPPYWRQAKGKYSEDATDLSNVDLDTFLLTIGNIARDVKRKWASRDAGDAGRLALIIGPWKEDGRYLDLALLCYQRISKYLPLLQRVIVPYSTEVHGGAFVKRAKEQKEILYLFRDLMVFGQEAQDP